MITRNSYETDLNRHNEDEMVRILFGLFLLAIAAALVAGAGGIDVRSPADWGNIASQWTLPSKDDTERGLILLLGALVTLLGVVRLISPRTHAKSPV